MDSPSLKPSYRIGEISRLFGIGADSLRYYERLGILAPRRTENGYRAYDLADMYKLSIIRDLRRLDMPMAQIGEYLSDQTIAKTKEMLEREQEIIDGQMRALRERREAIERRERALCRAARYDIGAYAIEQRPPRACIQLEMRMEHDDEMDMAIQRLYREHEGYLPDLGCMRIGAVLAGDELAAGRTNVYRAMFFVLEHDIGEEANLMLPAGPYLTVRYRGAYEQNGPLVRAMLDYARQHGYTAARDPLELYEIDNRDTAREDEFLTTLELPLKQGEAADAGPRTRDAAE